MIECLWCGEPLKFVLGKGWVHQDGQLYKTKRYERCPSCGSRNIKEIKPKWGICLDCEDNFHMEYDDHCAMPKRG